MKHLIFPTPEQADAFVRDLQSQGVVQSRAGQGHFGRHSAMRDANLEAQANAATVHPEPTITLPDTSGEAGAEDAGAGAVTGTAVGAVVGAAMATIGTIASGGILALPVLLGMTALGSGVGASVGAVGGAAGVDENHDGRTAADTDPSTITSYHLDDGRYDNLQAALQGGGRAIAVEDDVPSAVVEATASRHGGRFV